MSERSSTTEPEELARLRAAFATIPAPSESPLPLAPERIWAAARGELEAQETASIVDQLHRDPALALEWRLALELAATEPERPAEVSSDDAPRPAEPSEEPSANDRRYWYVGLLGAAAAAALGVLMLRPGETPRPPPERDETGPVLRAPTPATAIATELPDGVTLPRARFELHWSAVPGADHYELRLTTAALDPLHRALDLRTTRATIPASALATLAAGEGLLWQVTAVLPDGERLGSPAWRVVVE